MPLIKCETVFDLTKISGTPDVGWANPSDATLATGTIFQINKAKL